MANTGMQGVQGASLQGSSPFIQVRCTFISECQPSSWTFKGVSGACSSSRLGLHSKDAGAFWRDSTALSSVVEMEAGVGGIGYEGFSPLRLWILFSLGEPLPGWQVPKLAEFVL